MLETHLRQAATVLLESTIRIAPPDTRDWGRGMLGELSYVKGPWAVAMWAVGGASVLAKSTLASLFIPGRRGQGLVPDGGLFARSIPLRKVTLVACGVFVMGALLFFLAPPFRQGIRISLAAWKDVISVTSQRGQPGLVALAKRAEALNDAEGLAFAAARLLDAGESARLAEKAVRLEPNLIWVYAVVAVRHPELAEIREWVPKLERWDPQNALFHLITAESIDIDHIRKASELPPHKAQQALEGDPAWQKAMTAAFASPKLDGYLGRLRELDRRVVSRYRFNDPYELLSGEEAGLPTYAFGDSQRFAKFLLQSGEEMEARGDREGAREKFWAVGRFGQVMDSQGQTAYERWAGTTLQAMAYKQLQALSEKEGNASEAAHFGYLTAKFDPEMGKRTLFLDERVFGRKVSTRNALVLQISSLLFLVFSGLMAVAAAVLVVGSRKGKRPTSQRAKPMATAMALVGAVGFLISSATIYLTYRPYWYIFQSEILNGNRSHAGDLRDFLMATEGLAGIGSYGYGPAAFPFYFWTAVTLLGVAGVVLLLRHLLGRPRPNAQT